MRFTQGGNSQWKAIPHVGGICEAEVGNRARLAIALGKTPQSGFSDLLNGRPSSGFKLTPETRVSLPLVPRPGV